MWPKTLVGQLLLALALGHGVLVLGLWLLRWLHYCLQLGLCILRLLQATSHTLHGFTQRIHINRILILIPILLLLLAIVFGEVREALHQLVALRDGYIGVVDTCAGTAVHIEPPIAFENRLVEERVLRAQEGFAYHAIIGESAYVKYLAGITITIRDSNTKGSLTSYHAAQIGVGIETREVLLLAAGEACGRQIHLRLEVIIEVLVIAHGIILLGCIHDLIREDLVTHLVGISNWISPWIPCARPVAWASRWLSSS